MEDLDIKILVKKKLKELSEEKYQEFHSGLCPNTDNILGVRIPILRKYAKVLLRENKIEKLLEEIDDEYYEEIVLKGMIIGLSKEKNFGILKRQIKEFIPKISNWAICDIFCAGLKTTKKNKKEMWEFIGKYLKSKKEFELRFSIVMILDYYIEEEYLEEIFNIFDDIKSEQYYVQMAIAWAISICLIKFFDKTINFLEKSTIDSFTFNKALQKGIESFRISDEQKIVLRKMKRKVDNRKHF